MNGLSNSGPEPTTLFAGVDNGISEGAFSFVDEDDDTSVITAPFLFLRALKLHSKDGSVREGAVCRRIKMMSWVESRWSLSCWLCRDHDRKRRKVNEFDRATRRETTTNDEVAFCTLKPLCLAATEKFLGKNWCRETAPAGHDDTIALECSVLLCCAFSFLSSSCRRRRREEECRNDSNT